MDEINILYPILHDGEQIFRNVLRKKAMEMILLGEQLSATQALDMGLVTRVCSKADFEAEVDRILKDLAAKSPVLIKE